MKALWIVLLLALAPHSRADLQDEIEKTTVEKVAKTEVKAAWLWLGVRSADPAAPPAPTKIFPLRTAEIEALQASLKTAAKAANQNHYENTMEPYVIAIETTTGEHFGLLHDPGHTFGFFQLVSLEKDPEPVVTGTVSFRRLNQAAGTSEISGIALPGMKNSKLDATIAGQTQQ